MKIKNIKDRFFYFSFKDTFFAVIILSLAFVICFLLKSIDESTVAIPMIFLLAVFLISRYTTGYVYGIISSFIGVLGVNYLFTYPYFKFNFTLAGYPISIISMLVVSIITSTLNSRIKQQEKMKIENEIERTQSNLLRSISHDIRTPLTSILGATSAIIENDEKLKKEDRLVLLHEVKDDAQWLIRMVENLLSITRITDDRVAKIEKQLEAVEEIVADAVQKFQKRFTDIQIHVSVPNEILMIPMDAILIEQVILNLLENAAIHSKIATKIELNVFKNDNYAVFEVNDNGLGVSKKVLPHIFEGYFINKADGEVDSKKNMGIGLSVCYTIVKAHNGNMTVENLREGGASFKFYLPLEDNING